MQLPPNIQVPLVTTFSKLWKMSNLTTISNENSQGQIPFQSLLTELMTPYCQSCLHHHAGLMIIFIKNVI